MSTKFFETINELCPLGNPQPCPFCQVSGEHHRLCGYTQLLHGYHVAKHTCPPFRQHRDTRIFFDHTYPKVIQTYQTLARAKNTHTYVQGIC